jgi:hypothetical protein
MRRIRLSLPELMFIAGTRAALGAGIGLLLSLRLGRAKRRRVGLGLVTAGGLATVPAALLLARRRRLAAMLLEAT